jgi:hypothetical protein
MDMPPASSPKGYMELRPTDRLLSLDLRGGDYSRQSSNLIRQPAERPAHSGGNRTAFR